MKRNVYGLLVLASFAIVISVGSFIMAQPPRDRDGNSGRRNGPPRFQLGDVFPPELLDELNLTAEQERKLEAIKLDLKTKLEILLTDEQMQKIETFRPRGPRFPGGEAGPRNPGDGDAPPARDGRGVRGGEQRNRAPADTHPLRENNAASNVRLKELPKGVTRVPVTFSGGHETDDRDHGRPVVLIAAALGVTPEVFRDAFSRVRPARDGREPEPAQVRQNKAVLMDALEKYGITNEQLDTVSNYYRYPPGRKSLWKCRPAVANALVKDGSIIGYEIVDGGSGYSSTPSLTVPNFKGATAEVELAYGKDTQTNGSVSSISPSKPESE